jgi:kumamolisin
MTQDRAMSVLQESAVPAHLLHTPAGPVDGAQTLRVALQLHPQCGEDALLARAYALGEQALAERNARSPFSLDPDIKPTDQAVAAVRTFCAEQGFTLERNALGGLFVTIAGRAAELGRAFGVDLRAYRHQDRTFRAYAGCITLPAILAAHVRAVHGLDQVSTLLTQPAKNSDAYTEPPTLANNLPTVVAFDYYQYPPQWTGKGATVAFIESDLAIDLSNIQAFYASLPVGPVKIVPVGGYAPIKPPDGAMQPIGPALDGEAMMDLKLTGAVAPDATLVVYGKSEHYGYAEPGWIDTLLAALDQPEYPCQVMSISLGAPECNWVPQTAMAVHLLFAIASLYRVTVCVSSGDYGAPGNSDAYPQNCAFPASSPFCLACGGTELVLEAQPSPQPPKLVDEVVWNEMTAPYQKLATGGGISMMFQVPDFQQGLALPAGFNTDPQTGAPQAPGRGVPDVAANASPKSGYGLDPQHTGTWFGTSAAAPMWAGLIALLVEGNGGRPIGYLNPWLYASQVDVGLDCCKPITEGDNGPPDWPVSFAAGAPWNACCGLGTPLGINIAKALGLGETPKQT